MTLPKLRFRTFEGRNYQAPLRGPHGIWGSCLIALAVVGSVNGMSISNSDMAHATAMPNAIGSGMTSEMEEMPSAPPGGTLTAVCSGNITTYATAGACSAFVTVAQPGVSGLLAAANVDTVLNLEGASDYAFLQNPITDDLTIEFWMKTTQVAQNGLAWWNGKGIVYWNVTGESHFGISLLGKKLAFGTGIYSPLPVDDVIQSLDSVNSGNWIHVACTRKKSSKVLELYINGILNSSIVAASNPSFNTSENLILGNASSPLNSQPNFNGSIDDLRIWNTVRSATQIAGDMANTTPSNTPGLKVYYPFDQGTPCGNNAGITTVNDKAASGGNNTAILNNFTLIGCASNWSNSADNVAASYTLTNSWNGTDNASADYPVGSTTVNWTISAYAETAACSQVITVLDTVKPIFSNCPGDILVNDVTNCSGLVNWSPPTVIDNCGGTILTQVAGPSPGTAFPIGTTTVTYEAVDASGNSSMCSFNVTINFRRRSGFRIPDPFCSSDAPVDLNLYLLPMLSGHGESVVSTVGISMSDAAWTLGGNIPGPGTTFDPGDEVVIKLQNTLTIGKNLVVRWKSNSGTAANLKIASSNLPAGPFTDLGMISTSNTGWYYTQINTIGGTRFIKLQCMPGSAFAVDAVLYDIGSDLGGTWTGAGITGNLFDPAGQSGPVNITYTVSGQGTTKAAQVASPSAGGILTGGDVCPGSQFTATLSGQGTGDIYWSTTNDTTGAWTTLGPLGTSYSIPSVTQDIWIKAGVVNAPCPVEKSNMVLVRPEDNEPPVIGPCTPDITEFQGLGLCGVMVSYTLPSAADACGGPLQISATDPAQAPNSTFPVGVNTVELKAVDQYGNSSTCSFTIAVIDNTAPLISCPPAYSWLASPTLCGAYATYASPTAYDPCAPALVPVITDTSLTTGHLFPIGMTTVEWTAQDSSGNVGTRAFTITVEDNSPPNFTAPTVDTLYLDDAGQTLMPDLYAQLAGLWDCSGTVLSGQTPDQGTVLTGNTVAWIQVADSMANDTNVSISIVVMDTIRPTIICPPPDTAYVPSGDCGLTYVFTTPMFSDNSGSVISMPALGPYLSGDWFPLGVHTVQYQVIDPGGNSSTCTATVHVIKAPLPAFNYPEASYCGTYGTAIPAQATSGVEYHSSTGLALDLLSGMVTLPGCTAGNYIVYRIYPGSCPDSMSTSLTIIAPPNAGSDGILEICNGSMAVDLINYLGGAPDINGTWTGNGIGPAGNFNPGAYPSGTYRYIVAGGVCANDTANIQVIVGSSLNAGSDASATVCANAAEIPLITYLDGADSGGWWSFNGTPHGPELHPGTDAAGTYTYYLDPDNGCDEDSAAVYISYAYPVDAGADASLTACTNSMPIDLAPLLGIGVTAGGAWTGPSQTIGGYFDPATLGIGDYTYTVTGDPACGDDQATVTVALLVPGFAGSDTTVTVCGNGSAIDLESLLAGTDGTGTWLNGTSIYDPSLDDPGIFMYRVPGNYACPADTAMVTILEQAAPNAGTNAIITVCSSGGEVNMFDQLSNAPQSGGEWTDAGGTVIPDGLFDPATILGGTYTYTVSGTAPCASAQATVTINVVSSFHSGADTSIHVCNIGAAIDLSSLLPGADAGGTWSNGDGIYDPPSDPPGTITYTVDSNGQCPAAIANITITEEQAPEAGIGGVLLICTDAGPVALFSGLAGTPWITGTWTGPDSILVNGQFDPTSMPGGNYSYTVQGTDLCPSSSATVEVTVTNTPSAAWTPPPPMCADATPVDLTLGVTGTTGGSFSGPGINDMGNTFDPQNLLGFGGTGAITVTYSVTANGCDASEDGVITVLEIPVADAGPDTVVCGTAFSLEADPTVGNGSWSASAGNIFSDISAPDATVQVSANGVYHFQWTVLNGSCSATDEVQVVFHLPEELTALNAGPDQVQEVGTSAELQGIAWGATETSWTVVSGSGEVISPTELNTVINGLSNGGNLVVLNARVGSCPVRTDTMMITVRGLFIPMGFSPDGDGVNDRYVVRGLYATGSATLDVFDRWGTRVYHATSYDNTWDGHGDNGELLPGGTYFGVLRIGGEETWNGAITLKR